MNRRAQQGLLALLLLLSVVPTGAGGTAAAIRLDDAWVRAMPPLQANSAGYVRIGNDAPVADELLGARIDGVRVTELHEMVRAADGTLSMQHRDSIPVPARGSVALAPGGLHLMLIDVQRPVQPGEKLTGVLRFRNAGDVSVKLDVRKP